jgi:NB-ARC domain
VLVVPDDLWSLDHATALDAVGAKGRLLLTTRDVDILIGLGAAEYQVNVLPPAQAHLLLADWADQDAATLPEVARRVAGKCGHLPLALAMIGAMVRHRPGGWADALARLERAELEKLRRGLPDYPYPDLLRAIAVRVDALPASERERYRELAIIPEEAAAPEAMLETLWAPAGLSGAEREECG